MRRVLVTLIWLVVLGVLLEGVLRFAIGLGDPPLARLDPETEYELLPSASYVRWGNVVDINAFGMRTRDHAPLPEPNERRVLLIGDSLIYGTHFLDQQETIAAVLESVLLAGERLNGCQILAIPMAVSSWGPQNQAAFLAREGTFGAKNAVFFVSAHDIYDLPGQPSDILPYRTAPSWTAIGDAVQTVLERLNRPRPVRNLDRNVMVAQSLSALTTMVEQLRSDAIDPIMVYQPAKGEGSTSPEGAQVIFRGWAESEDVRFFDLADVMSETDSYLDDLHPSATGAAKIAGALAEILGPDIVPCSAIPGE